MKFLIRALIVFAVSVLPYTASAAYFGSGEQVSLGESLSQDAYLAGSLVTVSQSVQGDLFAAGASVNVTGAVSNDLFAAGSSVIISSDVGDDVRVAGSQVIVSGAVAGDLFAAGSLVQLTSTVAGDAHLAGAAVMVDGTVKGKLVLGSASANINGHVEGDAVVYAEEIVIGPQASIGGVLTYYANQEMDFGEAQIGSVVYGGPLHPDEANTGMKEILVGLVSLAIVIKILGLLTVGLIIGLVWPKTASHVAERTVRSFGKSLLTGFLATVSVPVVIILLAFTVIGWPLAGMLMSIGLLMSMLTSVYMGIVIGNAVIMFVKKQSSIKITWYGILLGVVLMALFACIPVIGWILLLLGYFAVLGSLMQLLYEQAKKLD